VRRTPSPELEVTNTYPCIAIETRSIAINSENPFDDACRGAAAVVVRRPLATSRMDPRHPKTALLSRRLPIIGTMVPARTSHGGYSKGRR
jgi:hypothetical protein